MIKKQSVDVQSIKYKDEEIPMKKQGDGSSASMISLKKQGNGSSVSFILLKQSQVSKVPLKHSDLTKKSVTKQ